MTKKKNIYPGIQQFKLKDLRPAEYNPREISEESLKGLTESIKRFGFVEPIIVNVRDGKNTIVGGNQRFKALKRLATEGGGRIEKEIICITVDLSETDERVLNLTLNNPHIQGEFIAKLNDYIDEMRKGMADEEAYINLRIAELRGEIEKEGKTGDDEIPELPKKTKTKPGDLNLLGEHRLLCGDSTKEESVARLMNGQKANLIFTDPPYGANISGIMQSVHGQQSIINRTRRWEQIKGDENQDANLQEFLEKAFNNFSKFSLDEAAWYIWHAMLTQGFFSAAAAAAAAADLILNRQIVWVKPCLILAFGHYHWRHELCFYGWKKGNKPNFYGGKNETTVWEIDFDGKKRMPAKERLHPTQKPVALGIRAISNSTKKRQIILDGFIGTGSTLIACEKLGRRCFGMEIEPLYCDVAVQRWEKWTGKKAELVRGGGIGEKRTKIAQVKNRGINSRRRGKSGCKRNHGGRIGP